MFSHSKAPSGYESTHNENLFLLNRLWPWAIGWPAFLLGLLVGCNDCVKSHVRGQTLSRSHRAWRDLGNLGDQPSPIADPRDCARVTDNPEVTPEGEQTGWRRFMR